MRKEVENQNPLNSSRGAKCVFDARLFDESLKSSQPNNASNNNNSSSSSKAKNGSVFRADTATEEDYFAAMQDDFSAEDKKKAQPKPDPKVSCFSIFKCKML